LQFLAVFAAAFYVVTVAALLALAWLAGHSRCRREAGMLLHLTSAGLAAAYPIFDSAHLRFGAPAILVGAAYAVDRTRPLPMRWLAISRTALAVAVGLAACVLVLRSPARVLLGRDHLSSRPHFRAAIVTDHRDKAVARNAAIIARAARGQPMFLLMRDAGLYYLLSGVRNPTRFDLPVAIEFGRSGEEEVGRQILDGSIPRVCVESTQDWGRNTPLRIMRFVRQRMRPVANLGVCRLYDGLTARGSADRSR
jgi:hypothetical protein